MSWSKIEFGNTENIVFFIIPVVIIIILIAGSKKKEEILKKLNLNYENKYRLPAFVLITAAATLIVISLLGPQAFKGYRELKREGLDIYVLFDTSKSMLAEDIKPNRLELGKNIVKRLLDTLEGDRVGFIPFSSDAYIQMPLTDDYELAGMFLKVIDTDMIAGGGTNLAAAINLARSSFTGSAEGDRVILIISDGEEHENSSMEIIKDIRDENIKVFAIGIGTEKGSLIPEYDSRGRPVSYKQDQRGEYVITRLQADSLKKLAEAGGGAYFQASAGGQEINSFLEKISSLKRSQYEARRIRSYTQLYQYFLGPALILVITGYLLLRGVRIGEK